MPQNPMLLSLLVALVISLSGLRIFLDPKSADYVVWVGWIALVLGAVSEA